MTPKKMQFKSRLKDLSSDELSVADDFFNTSSGAQPVAQPSLETTSGQHAGEDVWMASPDGYDGQLAVDVYHDQHNVYLRAIVGGIDAKDIEVHMNNDMVTIKGKRILPGDVKPENYFIQECYWGGFSRSIILPVDIKHDGVEAKIEHGILLVTLPKSHRPKNTRIPIQTA